MAEPFPASWINSASSSAEISPLYIPSLICAATFCATSSGVAPVTAGCCVPLSSGGSSAS